MAENDQTKVCPLCAETIKVAAKLCPFCQSRQSRFTLLEGEIVGAVVGLILLVALTVLGSRLFPDEPPDSDFARHRAELPVGRTIVESVGMKPRFWLTGYVTNTGNRPWRVHEMEVRFLDSQGNLLDVQHPDFNKTQAFVVQPNQEHAFRIQLDSLIPTNSRAVHIVRVQTATDGRRSYDPN